MTRSKLKIHFRHLPLTVALFLIGLLFAVVSFTATVSQASQGLTKILPTTEALRLGWRLPAPPHDFAWYRSAVGFNAPTDPNSRLQPIDRQRLAQYLTNGGYRGASLRAGAAMDPAMVIWWAISEGMSDNYIASNCADRLFDIKRDCWRGSMWQVGYGIQVNDNLSQLAPAIRTVYPGRTAESVGNSVLFQSASPWTYPTGLEAATIAASPYARSGRCGNPDTGAAYDCFNRYWGSVLMRDPAVGAYLEAGVSFPCYKPGPPAWCSGYYQDHKQEFSNNMAKVLNTWSDLSTSSAAHTGYFVDRDADLGNLGEWDHLHVKASCAAGTTLAGLSQQVGGATPRTALCVGLGDGRFSGSRLATLAVPGDQRRARRVAQGFANDDWAYGYYKLECGSGEYVNGVSANASFVQGDHRFHAVSCAAGSANPPLGPGHSTVRTFDAGDDRGDVPRMDDWDFGAFKGQCALNEYVVGISVSPSSGAPHSILCAR